MTRETSARSLWRPQWRERHASRRSASLHRVAHLAVRPAWDRGRARHEERPRKLGRVVLGAVLAGVGAGMAAGALVVQHERGMMVERPALALVEQVELSEVLEDEAALQVEPAVVSVLSDEAALEEARALGLLEVIRRTRPTMREVLVKRLGTALVREAAANGLDPLLLSAVAKVESHFNPFATSVVGARGVLQVRPITGRGVLAAGGETLVADDELYDLETNVALGARYLASLISRTSSLERALVAYNRGPTGARRALAGPDAQEILDGYPRKVLTALDGLRAHAALARNGTAPSDPQL